MGSTTPESLKPMITPKTSTGGESMAQGRLYHYTDLQTLALILNNQTIRFSPLTRLDDPQEKETADVPNFGQSIFVSCWTQSKNRKHSDVGHVFLT